MNPNRNKHAGRKYQAKLARLVGGKSVGTIEGQDIEHPMFSFEAKKRQAFVACAWMNQARRNAPEGKVPVVVVHVTGQRHSDDLVVCSLRDWLDLHGPMKGRSEE